MTAKNRVPLPPDWRVRISAHEPERLESSDVKRRAATAVVFVESAPNGPELILMRRAHREGDPWSGQISFPGGHEDPTDASLDETARREAHEELGLELGEVLGQLDDRPVHTGPHTVVTPYVFTLETRPTLRLDPREATAGLFVPVTRLVDPQYHTIHRVPRPGFSAKYPGVELDDGSVVWGLTYRSVAGLLEILGYSVPLSA